MASPAELLALAERVEAAEGPDRELWGAIVAATDVHTRGDPTASLDAAMTLAPDGYFRLNVTKDGAEALALTGSWVKAKTPALALTAACLRALASRGEG